MNEKLQSRCERFIKIRDTLKSTFKMENVFLVHLCAANLLSKSAEVTPEKLKLCKNIINSNTGLFSSFRGNARLPLTVALAASNAPQEMLDATLSMYQLLKKDFSGSEYLALTACILTEMVSENDAVKYINRGKVLYKKMKSEHPFLTASEDIIFAILLAFSEKSDDELIEEMENIYKRMKMTFSDNNAVQTLSHVLSLTNGSWEEKCDKFYALYLGLKNQGKSYGKHFQISILGSAAILPIDLNELVNDIIEIDNFLEKQKGYGGLGIDKKNRLMHAVMIAVSDRSENIPRISATMATLAMVAAEQAATLAAISATAAATASTPN